MHAREETGEKRMEYLSAIPLAFTASNNDPYSYHVRSSEILGHFLLLHVYSAHAYGHYTL